MLESLRWQHMRNDSPWRDIMVVVGVTGLSGVLSVYFNLNEALYAFTRGGERYQIDELPISMLVPY